MDLFSSLGTQLRPIVLGMIPVSYLLAALFAASGSTALALRWSFAVGCATAAFVAAILSAGLLAILGPGLFHVSDVRDGSARLWPSLRLDVTTVVVLLLVTFVGWVIARYSRTYLSGEARQPSYIAALMATLAAVSAVVCSNNLGVLALAWLVSSLTLHRLLTFYRKRPAALVAAHKKFLSSRLADLSLFSAVALIGVHFGTLEIDRITYLASTQGNGDSALTAAAVLIVVTALLRCAQLPMHGWLIQVMEAPTPVSALLHAGIVNLGGFVLIRLAPLITEVPSAQVLLVVVGGLTAGLAALVMMTRISIKVMLAWSTCAQMGFMLLECGLGLYDLALLHLVAHSLYKAYAFLSAGGAVEQARIRQLTRDVPAPGLARSVLAAGVAFCALFVIGSAFGVEFRSAPAMLALAVIACCALAPMLATSGLRLSQGAMRPWLSVVALGTLYFGLHALVSAAMTTQQPHSSMQTVLAGAVSCWFVAIYCLQAWLRCAPQSPLSRRMFPVFYGGLFLDEAFTRATFRIWPMPLPGRPGASISAGIHTPRKVTP